MQFYLTGGETSDYQAYPMLMDLAERKPEALLADKGYDSNDIRENLRRRGIKSVIPPRSNRKTPIRYDRKLYKKCDGVARIAFNRPEVRNAFRPKTTFELLNAFEDATHAPLS